MNSLYGDLILGLIAMSAVVTTAFSFFALLWVTRRRKALPDHTPALTIFKPLKGVDEGLEANLRSFFDLDYPAYQLLFGVADDDDPAIPIVERLIAEHPGRDARLVIGAPAFGLNPKVENLAAMWPYRRTGGRSSFATPTSLCRLGWPPQIPRIVGRARGLSRAVVQ